MEQQSIDARTLALLQRVARFFAMQHPQPAYLVGGSLRNLLLGERCTDWDIATTGDTPRLARRLADALGGYYAHMHMRASRVICKHDDGEIIFDVSPIEGASIEEDLRARDFTVNALALPLIEGVARLTSAPNEREQLPFIDLLHGRDDLRRRLLRATSDMVFRRDPLRLLRAVRQATLHGFTIEPVTGDLLRRDAALLPRVAPERIHD